MRLGRRVEALERGERFYQRLFGRLAARLGPEWNNLIEDVLE